CLGAADHRDVDMAKPEEVLGDESGAGAVVRHLGRPSLGAGCEGNHRPTVVRDATSEYAHAAPVVSLVKAAAGKYHAGDAAQAQHLHVAELCHRIAIAAAYDR